MLIKSVKLSNIRSYKEAKIEFPKGSVLLTGDIGSGKSTIFYAIEFALFGIKRGELSGTALLRHGAKEAFVELSMEICGKEVTIKRALKRTAEDVKQDSGYIIIDGVKTEGTAVEIKARVLELLGYPKDILSKGKDLIYRFTVYTPQEEIKMILYEDSDIRLDTLRKLFGIDRYKRIRENAVVYIRELRQKTKELEGMTSGIEEKKKIIKERAQIVLELKENLAKVMPELEKAKHRIKGKKESLGKHEDKIKKLVQTRNEVKIIETQLMGQYLATRKNNETIERITKIISEAKKDIKQEENEPEMIAKLVNEKQEELSVSEKKLIEASGKIREADVRIRQSEEVKAKIAKIDKCPTCEQQVSPAHSSNITERENQIIKLFLEQKNKNEEIRKMLAEQILSLKGKIEELRQKQRLASVFAERIKGIKAKEIEIAEIKKDIELIKKDIGSLNAKKLELNRHIEENREIEKNYELEKNELEKMQKDEKEIDMEGARLEATIKEAEKTILLYDKEIKEKEKYREIIGKIEELRNWLEEHFLNLMVVMEKHIMARLHLEFNEFFTEWFRVLISDEAISVRLDDQFTPVIEQNGYETELLNLSGGEKTSVALAYRLALNKVINDFITEIKTRDIIMLDEPTDGFSEEQLDRVREVLEQINVKQLIIVSHEPKIEGFVENIIRVNKMEHESSISEIRA